MSWDLPLREPSGSISHAFGAVCALIALRRFARGGAESSDGVKRLSLTVFAGAMAFCYTASAVFHGAIASKPRLELLERVDHFGIYVLIAGSYSPIAMNAMSRTSGAFVMGSVWGVTAMGGVSLALFGLPSRAAATVIYLVMGWGAIFCYIELARRLGRPKVYRLMEGGVLYSIGAVINLAHDPLLEPLIMGPHEIFHCFVLAGSHAHYRFMVEVIVPYQKPTATSPGFAWDAPRTSRPRFLIFRLASGRPIDRS